MVAASSAVGAIRTSSLIGKRERSDRRARPEFTSEVCWERTVRISFSSGARFGRHADRPSLAIRRSTTRSICDRRWPSSSARLGVVPRLLIPSVPPLGARSEQTLPALTRAGPSTYTCGIVRTFRGYQ